MTHLETTILVVIAALDHISMAYIYITTQRWRTNRFTLWITVLTVSFSLILTYAAYNAIAFRVGWPLAVGTWIADLAYGIVAVVGLFGTIVFYQESRQQRRRHGKSGRSRPISESGDQ